MAKRKKRQNSDSSSADLTPMIDVVFQLLIFFIIPKEQITIYCMWDPDAKTHNYVVAIDARGRVPVENSMASLEQLVIFPNDGQEQIRSKKALYAQIFDNVVGATEARRHGCSSALRLTPQRRSTRTASPPA
jgi:hypothetical protein